MEIRWTLGLVFTGLVLLAAAAVAPAATYKPNKLGDHAPNGCTRQDCTLREAVIKANAHGGPDKLVLRGGKTYRRGGTGTNEDAALDGDVDVTDPLRIRSSNRRRATIDANGNERVLHVLNGPTALARVKLKGGDTGTLSGFDAIGGGVLAETPAGPFSLRVTRSVISGNESVQYGGGIGSDARLTVRRSRLTGNVAAFTGGGMRTNADATVANSTISGNRATASGANGGGISNAAGALTVTGSTISGNTAAERGGGLHNDAEDVVTRITNTTIADNRALNNEGGGISVGSSGGTNLNAVTIARNEAGSDGGGIVQNFGGINIRNSLIALNSAPVAGPDCRCVITSAGYNLVGNTGASTGFGATGDRLNLPPSEIKIAQLARNGGPTKTIALRRGSQAINHAGPDAPARDQRGESRRNPDIGAFERTRRR